MLRSEFVVKCSVVHWLADTQVFVDCRNVDVGEDEEPEYQEAFQDAD